MGYSVILWKICCRMSKFKLPPLKEGAAEVADTEIRNAAPAKPRKNKKADGTPPLPLCQSVWLIFPWLIRL